MKNENILEICLSPDLGGLELFAVNCFEYFQKKTKCYIIVAPNTKLDNYIKTKKEYITRNKLFPVFPALKLANFIDKNNIDIIHFHWTKDIATVVLAKYFSKKKPKIIQTRNMTMTRFKDDFYHKWLYKNIDNIHAVTYQVKKQIEKFIPKDVRPKTDVVYMGVKIVENINFDKTDLKNKYNINNDDFIIGIIGRIEEAKGQYLLIEAINNLKNLPLKAMIVGHTMDQSYLDSLKEKIKNYNIEDKIIFTGFTKDVYKHISLCNITILATKHETFGLVIVESMMCKTPVLATNKGGPLEIIENNIDGILFERDINDLTQKIQYLYKNKKLLHSMGEKAYTKAKEKFEYNKQLEKLYTIIKGI